MEDIRTFGKAAWRGLTGQEHVHDGERVQLAGVDDERVVVGGAVIVADPDARAHTAIVVALSPSGTISLEVDWSSRPLPKPTSPAAP